MSSSQAPRVVVTGASGFIGSHLVRRLREAGVPVLAITRHPPSLPPQLDGVEYVARDLERVGSLTDVLRADDIVIHLAARVHAMRATESAESAFHAANVAPLRILVRSAVDRGARRLLFVSSAKVFGEGRERPYTRADPLAPQEPYARSKAEAEQVVRDAAPAGLEWTIIRPPFVYGPGGKGNFPRLVSLARLSARIPLPLASIDNRRSIVFVGNLVDLILRAAVDDRARGQVLLPTDASDVSTPELLRAICLASSSRARLFACPPGLLRAAARLVGRSAEMERLTETLRLDSTHLREELGWTPPFTLEAALRHSIGAGDAHVGTPSHD
jgi:UDP-N-acetyl-alpha-D-quinovosamine dehydrogenase